MDVALHPLRRDEGSTATAGDFGARMVGDALHVGRALYGLLTARGLRSAEEFVAYVHAFPDELACALGWTAPELAQASRALHAQLRGVVAPEVLDPPAHPEPSFGALVPTDRKRDN